jgi:uncharacterized protein CbrC (UPF0167 family)
MQTEFSRVSDPDKLIRDAAAERPGQAIKLRLQPMVLRATGQYQGWKQTSWTMECDNAAEVLTMRDAMQTFFETLGRVGPRAVQEVLKGLQKDAA